jgi:amidase
MNSSFNENFRPGYSRRGFLAGFILSAAALGSRIRAGHTNDDLAPAAFDLAELTIADLQERMTTGKETARSLAEKYLQRIEAIDRRGPHLRSVIELNPDALDIAAALDKERRDMGPRGPLHGIPIIVKDNIDTADRMATTAGSLALIGAKPPMDAAVVARLRKAGAVIIAKSNLSEWANARSSTSTSGWSGRGGLTRNPYVLDRNPCGSSSGSGVAVAANLCAVAVGTETDGSVVCPAAANGIVGVKPTVGLVSRTGIIPISHTQDTAGPMTRTVRDAAILLSAMAGADADDPATAEAPKTIVSDYAKDLSPGGLKGAKIGVPRNFLGFHDGVDRLTEDALAVVKRLGASLIDVADLPKAEALNTAESIVFQYEMKVGLNKYFARLGPNAPVKTVADVIAFNEKHRNEEMPYFGQDLLVKLNARGPLTSYEYVEALAKNRRLTRTEGIDQAMDKNQLDAIVSPTLGPACTTDLVNGDHWLGGDITSVAAIAGYPHVTVPMGFIFGLPVGLSFIGRAWSEAKLLQLAYDFEQATRARKPPRFLQTAELK